MRFSKLAMTPEELQILERIERHLPTPPLYVTEYVRSKKRAGLAANTLLQYIYRYQHFFAWLIREQLTEASNSAAILYTVLEKIRKQDVEFYIEFLREETLVTEKNTTKTRGESIVMNSIQALKSLFNYLTKETETETGEAYFDRNVMSKIVTHTKKESASRRAQKISSVILNNSEIQEFLDFIEHGYVETLTSEVSRSRYERDKEQDLAIIHLFLGSGIRVGESASLLTKNVGLKKKQVSVKRKGGKEDTVNIMDETAEYLRRFIAIREERYKGSANLPFLFISNYGGDARPLSRRAIENIVTKYTAAFFESEGISPHKLRHSFGADYIRNGGSIVLLRDQLGHNNFEATSLYTNLSNEDKEEVLSKMSRNRGGHRQQMGKYDGK